MGGLIALENNHGLWLGVVVGWKSGSDRSSLHPHRRTGIVAKDIDACGRRSHFGIIVACGWGWWLAGSGGAMPQESLVTRSRTSPPRSSAATAGLVFAFGCIINGKFTGGKFLLHNLSRYFVIISVMMNFRQYIPVCYWRIETCSCKPSNEPQISCS